MNWQERISRSEQSSMENRVFLLHAVSFKMFYEIKDAV